MSWSPGCRKWRHTQWKHGFVIKTLEMGRHLAPPSCTTESSRGTLGSNRIRYRTVDTSRHIIPDVCIWCDYTGWYWSSLGGSSVDPMNVDWVTSFKVSTFSMTTSDDEFFIMDENGDDVVNIMTSEIVLCCKEPKNIIPEKNEGFLIFFTKTKQTKSSSIRISSEIFAFLLCFLYICQVFPPDIDLKTNRQQIKLTNKTRIPLSLPRQIFSNPLGVNINRALW